MISVISVVNACQSVTEKQSSDFLNHAYLAYFKAMLGDQNKPWVATLCVNLGQTKVEKS